MRTRYVGLRLEEMHIRTLLAAYDSPVDTHDADAQRVVEQLQLRQSATTHGRCAGDAATLADRYRALGDATHRHLAHRHRHRYIRGLLTLLELVGQQHHATTGGAAPADTHTAATLTIC